MPRWAKYALIGAITTVATSYFLDPTLKSTLRV
jgi:hypothetical protein